MINLPPSTQPIVAVEEFRQPPEFSIVVRQREQPDKSRGMVIVKSDSPALQGFPTIGFPYTTRP